MNSITDCLRPIPEIIWVILYDLSCSANSSIWQTKNNFISPQPVLWGFFFNLYLRLWRVRSLSVNRYSFSASDFVVNGYFSESLHWSQTRWSNVSLEIKLWSFIITLCTAESSWLTLTAYLSSLLRKGSWQSKHISSSNSFGWKKRLSRALLSPVRSKKPAPVSTTLLIDSFLSHINKKNQYIVSQIHTSLHNFSNRIHFHYLHLSKNSANNRLSNNYYLLA